jgi:hypothetical protein
MARMALTVKAIYGLNPKRAPGEDETILLVLTYKYFAAARLRPE